MNHTPTPWTLNERAATRAHGYGHKARPKYCYIGGAAGRSDNPIAHMVVGTGSADYDAAKANAAFIVRPCNAHDDLVEALEMLMQTCHEEGYLIRLASYRQAESALKLARGE